jgi:wyosine [tRNA(Phe)-imidazoG37] synthetase (radical SAM superfamily)
MSYIFGPVPSRRLGLSLGVDLVPVKTCSYDCLYCQVGRTTGKILDPEAFVPVRTITEELEEKLEKIAPDTITLSGSGEPTLYSPMAQLISSIKQITDIRIAILTNGSLFWNEEVRAGVLEAQIIAPTLSTVFEETYRAIHRPHADIELGMIIEGLKALRRDFRGFIFLEVVLLAGFNDSAREIEGLKQVIEEISPDRIQLNTVVRPPADSRALSLDTVRLEEIKNFFGDKAEIIADIPPEQRSQVFESYEDTILETARRRPMRAVDLANVLDLPLEDVEGFLEGLIGKGDLSVTGHGEETYYSALQ